MESMQYYNHMNQTDLTKRLLTVDCELETEDVKSIKFLCQDHIPFKTLEKISDGIQIFNELERVGKMDTSAGEVDYLLECLCRCHRMDLVKKLGFNQAQVKNRVESGNSNFCPFRILLFEIAEEMETTDIKTSLFTLSSIIPRSKHDKIESMFDVFVQLERSGELSPINVNVLYKLLKMLDRGDLMSKVRAYQNDQGIESTGGRKTEEGYGPVDEGQAPRTIEIAMEPEYRAPDPSMLPGDIQNRTENVVRSQQFVGNRLPLDRIQFQSSAAAEDQERGTNSVIDIRGQGQNKNSRQNARISEEMNKRLKLEDRHSNRVVPARTTNNAEPEQPLLQNTGNQMPTGPLTAPRTGTSGEIPNNHLFPRIDILEEEESPGDSGLTAGTVTLSDRSSQEISSGDVFLSLTESKMVILSEVIARHDDWARLAQALDIEFENITQIMQSNPTTVLKIHGFLKHWYFREKNKQGSSPNAEGLLKALKSIGYTDAIEEFVRISQESAANNLESEFGSENITAASVGSENYFVSTGEARVSQGEDMDIQGPAINHPRVLSHSDAQVGPSLNPLINQSIRQPNRQEEVIVRQMEAVAIDDSIMPFYKMNARPRGIAIIINNMNFYKVREDQSSKEMPARTGTEKDAEKLEYIWSKLGFIVRKFDDIDSVRMNQIMVEVAFEDHTAYDCLVCCILTHGVLGHVYGTDGRIVRINQLTGRFASRRCTSLAGKPKLFFIQACQGREKQEGHAIETDAGGVIEDSDNTQMRLDLSVDRPRELIPDEADFLLGYATVPGYVSYRSRSQGSWYINKLAQNLDKYAYQHDLLSILIKVNEEVGRATANIDNGAYKQIPAPMFTLRKRIIFQ